MPELGEISMTATFEVHRVNAVDDDVRRQFAALASSLNSPFAA